MIQAIPTRDADAYTQRLSLDGRIYQLRLVWRERVSSWYVDVRDRDGAPIIVGRRLTALWSPTQPARDLLRGLLLTIAPEGNEDDPGRDAFVDDGRAVLYVPAREVPAAELRERGRAIL